MPPDRNDTRDIPILPILQSDHLDAHALFKGRSRDSAQSVHHERRSVTGLRGRTIGHAPGAATNNTAKDLPATREPFVCAAEAAEYLGISRRFLLSLARRGIGGSYAIGGNQRHTWVFRLSELGIAIDHRHTRPFSAPKNDGPGYDPNQGSPR